MNLFVLFCPLEELSEFIKNLHHLLVEEEASVSLFANPICVGFGQGVILTKELLLLQNVSIHFVKFKYLLFYWVWSILLYY